MGLCAFVVGCIQDLSRMLGQARDLSWGLAARACEEDGAWQGSTGPVFLPPPLFLLLISLAVGTCCSVSLLHVAAGFCFIPALVGVGDEEGTWTSLFLRRYLSPLCSQARTRQGAGVWTQA